MFKKIERFYLLVSVVFTYLFIYRLKVGEFIYSGDAFFRINSFETYINGFFIRKYENLGVHNGWQFITQFWDVIYYRIFYVFSNDFVLGQKILLFIIIFFSFYLPYIGLRKIKDDLSLPVGLTALIAISAWYTINPYTVSLWHGTVYSLGAALTYSLAPLIVAHLHRVLFRPYNTRNIIVLSLYLGIASFTFWLFAPLALLLGLYLMFHLIFNNHSVPQYFKKVTVLIFTYVPLISFVLFSVLFEYFNSTGNNNSVFQPTFGNEQGGLWYQILMLFSWGIYTVWKPRAMYPFYKYYFTPQYIIATISVYGLIIIGLANGLRTKLSKIRTNLRLSFSLPNKIIVFFVFSLSLSIFLAKGAQPPLGEVFLYLYNHVPFFSVFRTPDIRFGFSIVLSLAILLILVKKHFRTVIFVPLLIAIIFIQSKMFFTGQAIYGEEIKGEFYDHIVDIPPDDYQIAKYINSDSKTLNYIMPLPAIEYGVYKLDNGFHLGQDLLPKLMKLPFFYLSQSNGTYTNSYKVMEQAIKHNDMKTVMEYPLKYFILRNDIDCSTCPIISEENISKYFKLVLENTKFKVYKNTESPSLINGKNVTFTAINPVTYRVRITNLHETQQLNFLSSFDKHWKIYISSGPFINEALSYIFKKPIIQNTHHEYLGFGNQWSISSEDITKQANNSNYTINSDGSINTDLVIFYAPQSWFYLSLLFSISTLVISICWLVRESILHKKTDGSIPVNFHRK